MAGIICLYRKNQFGILETDPVKANAHLSSLLNQMIGELKDGKDIQARQLFERFVCPYAGELFDEGVIRDLSNGLYSPLNFTGVEKAKAIAKVAKESIPGFTSPSFLDSPKPDNRMIAASDKPKKKEYPKTPPRLSLMVEEGEYLAHSSGESSPVLDRAGHKSLDNSPVHLVDARNLPVWNFEHSALTAEGETDPDLAAAIALSLADHAKEGEAAVDDGKAPA